MEDLIPDEAYIVQKQEEFGIQIIIIIIIIAEEEIAKALKIINILANE